jgi:hypothetical protein
MIHCHTNLKCDTTVVKLQDLKSLFWDDKVYCCVVIAMITQ